MVRLAIIGVGGYGWRLVRTIQELSPRLDCRLIAAAETRWEQLPEHRQRLREIGVRLYDDAMEMLDDLRGRCEGVYIATGIATHTPLAVAAAERGFHVHLEKPPASTVQDVDTMLEAFARAGTCCLVGFQAVHKDDVEFVRRQVASGRLGRVETLSCHAGWPRGAGYYRRNDWAGRLQRNGAWVLDGPATNALAHQITNLLLMSSPAPARLATPTAVRAELYAAGRIEGHDTAAVEIRTAEGPRAWFLASHVTRRGWHPVITVTGQRGTAVWHYKKGATVRYGNGTETSRAGDEAQFEKMVSNFIEAVGSGDAGRLRCPLGETRKMVLALDGAHESSGRIHRIDEQHVGRLEAGTPNERTVVAGLEEALVAAAKRPGLFSDLPSPPPWARRTEPFELKAYDRFPQRFACP